MFSIAVFCTDTEYHLVRGFLSSSPSSPDFKIQVDAMARTHDLPSSTSWDACYIEKASMDELRFWLPADTVDTIPDETPVFRISRDEDPTARAKTRKMVLKETRAALCQVNRLQQQLRVTAIDRELARLSRKRSGLDQVLEYEVLNRLMKVIDEETRQQCLTNEEIKTLKSANFNWFGYFVDLDTKFHGIGPDVRAIAMKVLEGAGEAAMTQFRICRDLMSRAGEQGRHEQQHPRPSVEHAKTLISTTAVTSPGLDVDWIHAMIDRSNTFGSEGEWDEREDLEAHIDNLQAEKAGLERLIEPTDYESEQ
ncbi:hypothetical protein DFH09DRAFT_1334049 [Mycena vulgaris]|nr:hypothetical protein DFH09DRAFT_1334049 [Mycena vulgaris]